MKTDTGGAHGQGVMRLSSVPLNSLGDSLTAPQWRTTGSLYQDGDHAGKGHCLFKCPHPTPPLLSSTLVLLFLSPFLKSIDKKHWTPRSRGRFLKTQPVYVCRAHECTVVHVVSRTFLCEAVT